jgi:hypothetical protein
MGFIQVLFWEFVQNLPSVLLFIMAVWFWARHSKGIAIALILVNSLVCPLIIRVTEPYKHGYVESLSTTIANIAALGILMFILVPYLGTESKWSNVRMDLVLGWLAGALLGIAQGLTTPEIPLVGVLLHSAALMLVTPLILLGTRYLRNQTFSKAMVKALLITSIMTVVISLLDYGVFFI